LKNSTLGVLELAEVRVRDVWGALGFSLPLRTGDEGPFLVGQIAGIAQLASVVTFAVILNLPGESLKGEEAAVRRSGRSAEAFHFAYILRIADGGQKPALRGHQ